VRVAKTFDQSVFDPEKESSLNRCFAIGSLRFLSSNCRFTFIVTFSQFKVELIHSEIAKIKFI
jgi:hypothetical protein